MNIYRVLLYDLAGIIFAIYVAWQACTHACNTPTYHVKVGTSAWCNVMDCSREIRPNLQGHQLHVSWKKKITSFDFPMVRNKKKKSRLIWQCFDLVDCDRFSVEFRGGSPFLTFLYKPHQYDHTSLPPSEMQVHIFETLILLYTSLPCKREFWLVFLFEASEVGIIIWWSFTYQKKIDCNNIQCRKNFYIAFF